MYKLLAVAAIAVITIFIGLKLFNPKIVWKCENGQWTKINTTTSAPPSKPCKSETRLEKEVKTISIYFPNKNQDPKGLFCDLTYSVPRQISPSANSILSALDELIKGPTANEVKLGYFTNFRPNVNLATDIKSKNIRLNFDSSLDLSPVNKCKWNSLVSQVKNTLKQFDQLDTLEIAIDDKSVHQSGLR